MRLQLSEPVVKINFLQSNQGISMEKENNTEIMNIPSRPASEPISVKDILAKMGLIVKED